jgi:RNA polymerase sigma-70 factor (ECF subfamily)
VQAPEHHPTAAGCDVSRSIVGARSGSSEALGVLLQHYRGYLLRVAREELASNLAPKVAHSDLVQETCLQAARDFGGFTGDSEWDLRVWLRQILLNTLRDADRRYREAARRAISREVSLQDHSDLVKSLQQSDPSPSTQCMATEKRQALRKALTALPEDYRLAIELRSLEGLPFEVVGRALGRTAAAASKLWSRAIVKLAEEISRHEL